jgi:hypothetical protein
MVTIAGLAANSANAVPVLCDDTAKNHMLVDSTQVTACVDAGVGNINGNLLTDDFLLAGGAAAGYVDAGVNVSFTTTGLTAGGEAGTWSIDGGVLVDAIGFKFGTGNTADEWFVYDLVAGVTSGSWDFIDVLAPGRGGDRLSHIQAYNIVSAPAPAILGVMGIGLIGMVVSSRLRRRKIS